MNARTLYCCVLLAVVFVMGLNAQPVVKCGSELDMHQSLTSIGRNITCTARFDVIRDTPVNITITLSDSLPGAGLLNEQTIDNLRRLAFSHDTFGLKLVFQYVIDPHVSAGYYRFIGGDTIEIVTPKLPRSLRTCATEARAIDFDKRTLTLYGTLFTYNEVKGPSAIVVERTFEGEMSETKVLENNRPELAEDLERAARYFNRGRFRGSVQAIPDEQFGSFRYLVRFKVVRLYRDQPKRYEAL